MATALNIKLSLGECGEYHVPGITVESAIKASEILQENHEIHHIFFNDRGFHSMSFSLFSGVEFIMLCLSLAMPHYLFHSLGRVGH